MRCNVILIYAILPGSIVIASGCAHTDDTTTTGSTPAAQNCDGSGKLVLANDQNYTFDGTLSIRSVSTDGGGLDLAIDFSDLTADLQGHPLDPTVDIESANMIVFRYLSQEEVQNALASNTLTQNDISLYVGINTAGRTSLKLSEFTLLGNDIDIEQYYQAGYGTWLLTVNSGTIPGMGVRMATFLDPGAGTATSVDVGNDSTTLRYSVDLHSLLSPAANAGRSIDLDWSTLTTAGSGGDFSAYAVDQVLLGHYAQTPAELEDIFLDLELITDDLWHFPVAGGTGISLSSGTSIEGDFTGLSGDGTWILALQCTTCANPAPPFLTVVEVCE